MDKGASKAPCGEEAAMKTLGIWLCLLSLFVSLGGIAPAEKRTQVYYNPEGGKRYHAVPDCASASEEYYPLTPIPLEALHTRGYRWLTRCTFCNARKKPLSKRKAQPVKKPSRVCRARAFGQVDPPLPFRKITKITKSTKIAVDLPRCICYDIANEKAPSGAA